MRNDEDYEEECRDALNARLYGRPNMSRREREEDEALDRVFGFDDSIKEEE